MGKEWGFLQEELEELIYLLQSFQERYPLRMQNYGVHLRTTQQLVETQLAELQRNEKQEQLKQIDSLRQSVAKSTTTDRRTSLRLEDQPTGSLSEYTLRGKMSVLDPELFIAQ